MSDKNNISEEQLKAESPVLHSLNKAELNAPDGYFETLADRVMERTQEAPLHQLVQPKSYALIWKVAAGIALALGLYYLMPSSPEAVGTELAEIELSTDQEETLDYLLSIDDELFYEVLADVSREAEAEEALDPRIEFLLDEDVELDELLNL